MEPEDPSRQRPDPKRERIPLERKISLKFKEFRGFITEYSSNISLGGMFITTEAPQPPGSVFDFEFRLADDDFQLIHGIGEVVWVREEASGPDHPPGMGIRFLHLGEGSRDLVRRMVDEHERGGGTPFDLEGHAPSSAPGTAAAGHEIASGIEASDETTRGPADELAETATLDLPEEPGETGRAEIEEPDESDELPYGRFDAAMASLRQSRAGEAAPGGGSDLPAGFEEVRAALRPEDAGAVEADPPTSTGPATFAPDPEAPHATSATEPLSTPASAPPTVPEDRHAAPRSSRGSGRKILWGVLALLLVGAVAAQLLVPGGLVGLINTGGTAPESAPELEEEIAVRTETPPPDSRSSAEEIPPEPLSPALDAEIVETTADPTEIPPAEAEEPEPPTPATPTEPFSRLENVSWRVEQGRTVVELELDGAISPERYSRFRLDGGTPREVVRLRGVEAAYSPTSLPVDGRQLEGIRIGYHERAGGNEIHVVLDLASSSVELTELEAVGNRLRVVLGPP